MSNILSKAGVLNLTLDKTRSHVRALSRFEPVKFASCINSCICYTGPYADLDECPNCGTLRLDVSGQARQLFSYIPLIPCLCALMSNRTYATQLQYCADEHAKTRKPRMTTDIFDGLHYRSLLKEHVVAGNGHSLTITSRIIVILHLASPRMNSLLLKGGSLLRGSFSFSTTIFLQSNTSKRTTFFVLGSYLVQKSHRMQTCSSICSCVNCLSSQLACLHMMPSQQWSAGTCGIC